MRIVIQRVLRASVAVDGEMVGEIGKGILALVGVEDGDGEADMLYSVKKLKALRIFEDENDKMNCSVADVGGSILLVSQFTLSGDARHGNRPSFSTAARPEIAAPLIERMAREIKSQGIHVETGRFQTHMEVSLVNDGPVTILLDSKKQF